MRNQCVSFEVGCLRYNLQAFADLIALVPECCEACTIQIHIFVRGGFCPHDDNPRISRFGHG
jgi:hypothetical protein